MALIASIDPGRGTGYASYNTSYGAFNCGETGYDQPLALVHLVNAGVIICEDFDINKKTAELTQQHDALQHIGEIKAFCAERAIQLVMRKRGDKKFGTMHNYSKLKALGWYVKTTDMHSADAAAHLLSYLVKNRLLRLEDQLALKKSLT